MIVIWILIELNKMINHVNKNNSSYKDLELKDISICFDIEKVKYGMKNRWIRTKKMPWILV